MPGKVKVIILRTAGTNCDAETAFAFNHFGASVELTHVNQLTQREIFLKDYHILVIPGGFTYGDDIESGRILANELRLKLAQELRQFMMDNKLILGICNGFQVLVRSGILPGALGDDEEKDRGCAQKVTLTNNDSGKFEDRWVHLKAEGNSVWTKDVATVVYFPVAHAEGKFLAKENDILQKLIKNNQVAFRYCGRDGKRPLYPENPNGSMEDIAGITDRSGRVLGLMPHPERHFFFTQHPFWTRMPKNGKYGDGARIF